MDARLRKLLIRTVFRSRNPRDFGPKGLLFLLARRFTPSFAVRSGRQTYYVDTTDSGIGYGMFMHGGLEDAVRLAGVLEILASLALPDPRGKTFVDVGANIGTTCIHATTELRFARALAFEPELTNYRLLRQNIVVNGLEDRIRAFNVALSDRHAEVTLELAGSSSGDHRLRVAGGSATPGRQERFGESRRKVVSVQATTFDRLVREGVVTIGELGLVWIDAQGHDGHVLAGARSLTVGRVPVVVELWPYGLARSGGLEMIEEIISREYTHFVDLRGVPGGRWELRPASTIAGLKRRYQSIEHTDLLLLTLPST